MVLVLYNALFMCSFAVQNKNDTTLLGDWRRVGFVEDFFDIIRQVHVGEKGHIGVRKTILEVSCFELMKKLMKMYRDNLTIEDTHSFGKPRI